MYVKTPKGVLSIRQGCSAYDEYDSTYSEHDNVHNEHYNNHNKITTTNNNQTKENRNEVNSSQASRVIPHASISEDKIIKIKIKKNINGPIEKNENQNSQPKTLSVARVLDAWQASLSKAGYKMEHGFTAADIQKLKIGLLPELVYGFIAVSEYGTIPEFFDFVIFAWAFIIKVKCPTVKINPNLLMNPSVMFMTQYMSRFVNARYNQQYKFIDNDSTHNKYEPILKLIEVDEFCRDKFIVCERVIEDFLLQQAVCLKRIFC